MNCSRCRSLYSSRSDDALDERLRAAFDEHVDGCTDCRETWRGFQEALAALQRSRPGRASARETERILAAVEDAPRAAAPPSDECAAVDRDAAFRRALIMAPGSRARGGPGLWRRVAALLVASLLGAAGGAWSVSQSMSEVARPSPPSPAGARRLVVVDTEPLTDLLRDTGRRVRNAVVRALAAGVSAGPPSGPAITPGVTAAGKVATAREPRAVTLDAKAPGAGAATTSDATLALAATGLATSAPAPAWQPQPGGALVTREGQRLTLTLVTRRAGDAPDFHALVPPLIELLQASDEQVALLAEARLESLREQAEALPGVGAALAAQWHGGEPGATASPWRARLGLGESPRAPETPDQRWRRWWTAAALLLPAGGNSAV